MVVYEYHKNNCEETQKKVRKALSGLLGFR